ncbi:biotin-dependent carboxyltransferase family protein [Actinoplanes sp. NPDC051859]|uniref:biotin-dependent carboxyltransferase family protein n=1 Tax=Actinoplanes sp. NPDC051859 TaxID=3363909 RepID=UPI0037A6F6E6
MNLTILRPGPLTVIKDAGRPGHAHQGVAPSGAVDRQAYARANALVGNPPGAAVLECTLGGLQFCLDEPAVLALTGTDAVLLVDGVSIGAGEVARVLAGVTVAVSVPKRGLRSYLAVRGGIDVAPVLGSRSTDLLAGLGPPRPVAGDILPIGASPAGAVLPTDLEVDLGPRDDWFTAAAVKTFLSATYTVTPAGNAIGLRLDGPALARSRTAELPSEGVVRGAVQVPPDGQPIVFQADHPVTGGYPVLAVLTPAAADRAAQLRPGATVRFTLAPWAD